MEKLTPLMQQYWDIKSQHQDKILLFRMGDFFEIFHQDAVMAAPILNITLTSRNKKNPEETKMCGVPYHSIAGPIAKLLAHGLKVAMCDQIEDPKHAKGIVKRAVTRVLTPGMVYDPETLDVLKANYMASFDKDAIAFVDVSTGEAFYYLLNAEDERKHLLTLLKPAEIVVSHTDSMWVHAQFPDAHRTVFDVVPEGPGPAAIRRLVKYIETLQGTEFVKSLKPFVKRSLSITLEVSETTLRHLEVFSTYKGDVKGSLYMALNRCRTSSGARLLRSWLQFPLADKKSIDARLNRVESWIQRSDLLKKVREVLSQMGDIERRLGKIYLTTCNARDLQSLAASLEAGLQVERFAPETPADLLKVAENLVEKTRRILIDEPPLSVREGGLIKRGYSAELDELMSLSEDAQVLLLQLENREKEKTGINSLKVRYNQVFGYYIEITKTHAAKAPKEYYRKQTLANAERFTTDELQKLEEKVLSARTRRSDVEYEVYAALREEFKNASQDLLALAFHWSEVDVIGSFAWLAIEQNYVRPVFGEHHEVILTQSRHPVIEQEVKKTFVPNSLQLKQGDCILLTGPNMAGKSTLMRQVAVTSLMAQMGCFVPASSAKLPVFKRLLTRIGASDSLSEGLSTFMVEMKETAEILKNCDGETLVVLDEIGRGTSTYDGMCLAQAILEHLLTESRAYIFFATHYHELTALNQRFMQIHNAHMAIEEKNGQIEFLHVLQEGPAVKSYGIHVAKLAGLPRTVTQRAAQLLKQVEVKPQNSSQLSLMALAEEPMAPSTDEMAFDEDRQFILDDLKEFATSSHSGLEALMRIDQWQKRLQK